MGEVFDRLMDGAVGGNGLREHEVWPIAKGLVEGLAHCHAIGVVHRDLKLENLMLHSEDGKEVVKIIDFGLAGVLPRDAAGKLCDKKQVFLGGTKPYMAPEQFAVKPKPYKEGWCQLPTDVWGIGIILFMLASGQQPWAEARAHEQPQVDGVRYRPADKRFRQFVAFRHNYGNRACKTLYGSRGHLVPFSRGLQNIIDHTLVLDPTTRPTASELLKFGWFQNQQQATSRQDVYRSIDDPEDEEEEDEEETMEEGAERPRFEDEGELAAMTHEPLGISRAVRHRGEEDEEEWRCE
uniref:non-specific serine/threonine protein kinase n=1 Tax=Haptolina brevifila TaxID=156173 RepID=A0A7S2DF79_9EUKA